MLIWNKILDGGCVKAKTQEDYNNIMTFNMVQLCREFGWTERECLETSIDFFEDCLSIVSLQNIKANPK